MPISAPRPQLVAIGKTRRGIDHNYAGIDLADKSLGVEVVAGNDYFSVIGTVGLDVLNGFVHAGDDFHGQDQIKILCSPVLFDRGFDLGQDAPGLLAAAKFNLVLGKSRCHAGQERCCGVLMNEQRFHGVADPRPLDLGIDADIFRHVQVGPGIDVGMADPFVMLDDGDGGVLGDIADQSFAASWNDKVDAVFQFEEFGNRLTVGCRYHLQGFRGKSRCLQLLFQQGPDGRIGVNGLGAAPEYYGVAAFEAQGGGV